MAEQAVQHRGMTIRAACQAFQISPACYRYKALRCQEDDEIAQWLLRLTDNNRNWGVDYAFRICAMSEVSNGTTSGSIGFTESWNSIYAFDHASAWSEPNLSH